LRKEGPAFDLPIALALLAMDGRIDRAQLREFIALGELALDGTVRAVHGILRWYWARVTPVYETDRSGSEC